MSLDDSLTPLEKSKLAVWDFPVSDKYTKVRIVHHAGSLLELFDRFGKACLRPACQTVQRMLWPGLEDHLRQVKDLLSLVTFIFCVKYFALLLGESTQVKYAQLTDPCNLIQVTQFQGHVFCPVFSSFSFSPFSLVGRP